MFTVTHCDAGQLAFYVAVMYRVMEVDTGTMVMVKDLAGDVTYITSGSVSVASEAGLLHHTFCGKGKA